MSFAEVMNRLAQPSPNVLPFLEQINGQLQVTLAAAPAESGSSSSTQLGTLTASRRNSKPFIVGFIPPDIEVNFIPVRRTFANLGDIQQRGAGGGPLNLSSAKASKYLPQPPRGEVPRTTQYVPLEDLRQALIDAYAKITGQLPDPNTLGLLYAQKALENGLGSEDGISTNNFNLGSSHAEGGKKGKYGSGPADEKEKKRSGGRDVVDAPRYGLITPASKPSTGTYYIADDHDSGWNAYPIAFNSFDSLTAAASYQLAMLAERYPGTFTATTPAEYNNALMPNGFKKYPCYHDNPKYQRDLEVQLEAYKRRGFLDAPIQSQYASSLTPSEEEGKEIQRYIQASGGFTGIETDPIGDRIGRNIEVDTDRLEIVAKQTEALRRQIELIRSTPPLVMLINPSSFTRLHEHAVDFSPKTRHGHVVHAWLERPMKISCSGVTAGQYAVDYEGAGGLTNVNRVHSISYGNLLSLVNIYRNNGIVYSGPETGAEIGIPIVPFTIFIYYDDHVYLGSFDDFSVEDSSDKPFQMSYNFSFTTRYDQHLDTKLIDDFTVATSLRF